MCCLSLHGQTHPTFLCSHMNPIKGQQGKLSTVISEDVSQFWVEDMLEDELCRAVPTALGQEQNICSSKWEIDCKYFMKTQGFSAPEAFRKLLRMLTK